MNLIDCKNCIYHHKSFKTIENYCVLFDIGPVKGVGTYSHSFCLDWQAKDSNNQYLNSVSKSEHQYLISEDEFEIIEEAVLYVYKPVDPKNLREDIDL